MEVYKGAESQVVLVTNRIAGDSRALSLALKRAYIELISQLWSGAAIDKTSRRLSELSMRGPVRGGLLTWGVGQGARARGCESRNAGEGYSSKRANPTSADPTKPKDLGHPKQGK